MHLGLGEHKTSHPEAYFATQISPECYLSKLMEIQHHARYIYEIIKQTAVLDRGLRKVGFNTGTLYTGITPPHTYNLAFLPGASPHHPPTKLTMGFSTAAEFDQVNIVHTIPYHCLHFLGI